jgi:hypothetical protein
MSTWTSRVASSPVLRIFSKTLLPASFPQTGGGMCLSRNATRHRRARHFSSTNPCTHDSYSADTRHTARLARRPTPIRPPSRSACPSTWTSTHGPSTRPRPARRRQLHPTSTYMPAGRRARVRASVRRRGGDVDGPADDDAQSVIHHQHDPHAIHTYSSVVLNFTSTSPRLAHYVLS